jgi:hypothetical protein
MSRPPCRPSRDQRTHQTGAGDLTRLRAGRGPCRLDLDPGRLLCESIRGSRGRARAGYRGDRSLGSRRAQERTSRPGGSCGDPGVARVNLGALMVVYRTHGPIGYSPQR